MMSKSVAIFLKEWREMLRDQRVIFGVFIGPLLFTIGLFAMIGMTSKKVVETARKTVIPIAIIDQRHPDLILMPLEKSGRFKIIRAANHAEGEALVKEGKARLLLETQGDGFTNESSSTSDPAKQNEPVQVKLLYDPSDNQSEIALRVIETQIATINREMVKGLLSSRGIDAGMSEPFQLKSESLPGRSSGFLLIMIPYFLMLWSLVGGMTIASDLVAGEKERGTMETLLTSPASRSEVVFGKFFALLSQAWVGILVQILGLGIGWRLMASGPQMAQGTGIDLTPNTLMIMLVAILPYSVLNTALLFMISTYSRNQREAQGYVTAASFVLMIPLIMSQFIGYFEFSRQWWMGLIPVLNVFQVVKQALGQQFSWTMFGLTLGSMSLLAVIALTIAIRMFKRETVLFRV